VVGARGRPDELDLVPFDPDSIDVRLQALDLAERPPVPHAVGEPLAALLLRVRDPDTDRQLRWLASTAGAEVDVAEETAVRMVRPFHGAARHDR
jgi:hypothetical protein